MRNGGLIDAQNSGKIVDAHICHWKAGQNFDACWVGKVGKIVSKRSGCSLARKSAFNFSAASLGQKQKSVHNFQFLFSQFEGEKHKYLCDCLHLYFDKHKRNRKKEKYSFLTKKQDFCKKGENMNSTQNLLFVLLLSVITSATDTNLNTNTNFLLLLLLALGGQNFSGNNSCTQNTCPNNGNSFFFWKTACFCRHFFCQFLAIT